MILLFLCDFIWTTFWSNETSSAFWSTEEVIFQYFCEIFIIEIISNCLCLENLVHPMWLQLRKCFESGIPVKHFQKGLWNQKFCFQEPGTYMKSDMLGFGNSPPPLFQIPSSTFLPIIGILRHFTHDDRSTVTGAESYRQLFGKKSAVTVSACKILQVLTVKVHFFSKTAILLITTNQIFPDEIL